MISGSGEALEYVGNPNPNCKNSNVFSPPTGTIIIVITMHARYIAWLCRSYNAGLKILVITIDSNNNNDNNDDKRITSNSRNVI